MTPRRIIRPMTSPLEGLRMVSVYAFPGIVGTQANPLPSGYATVPQVVAICCDIFQRYGRECDAYRRNKLARCLPMITPELLASQNDGPRRVNILADLKKMICYLSREHTRWQAHHGEAPRKYELRFIGSFLNLGFKGVSNCYGNAQDMVGSDRCFTDLYLRCVQALCDRFAVHFERSDGGAAMSVGGAAA